jgi:hypothetical protein
MVEAATRYPLTPYPLLLTKQSLPRTINQARVRGRLPYLSPYDGLLTPHPYYFFFHVKLSPMTQKSTPSTPREDTGAALPRHRRPDT